MTAERQTDRKRSRPSVGLIALWELVAHGTVVARLWLKVDLAVGVFEIKDNLVLEIGQWPVAKPS